MVKVAQGSGEQTLTGFGERSSFEGAQKYPDARLPNPESGVATCKERLFATPEVGERRRVLVCTSQ